MSENDRDASEPRSFTDLSSFESVRVQTNTSNGNIINGNQVRSLGTHAIEFHEAADDHPSVVVHRNGDRIDRIEFACPCGRATSITLEYDGE